MRGPLNMKTGVRYAALGAAPLQVQPGQQAGYAGPAAPAPAAQPGLAEHLATRAAGQLATNAIEKAGVQAAATAAGGPVGGWLAAEMTPFAIMGAKGLAGSFFNQGGQAAPLSGAPVEGGIPPEIMALAEAYMSGQITREEFIAALMEMGLPQEIAMEAVAVIDEQKMNAPSMQAEAPMEAPLAGPSEAPAFAMGGNVGYGINPQARMMYEHGGGVHGPLHPQEKAYRKDHAHHLTYKNMGGGARDYQAEVQNRMKSWNNQQSNMIANSPTYAKTGIHIKPENRGEFTRRANSAGMGVQAYANKVLSAPEGKYTPEVRKQANFARNAASWNNMGGQPVQRYFGYSDAASMKNKGGQAGGK